MVVRLIRHSTHRCRNGLHRLGSGGRNADLSRVRSIHFLAKTANCYYGATAAHGLELILLVPVSTLRCKGPRIERSDNKAASLMCARTDSGTRTDWPKYTPTWGRFRDQIDIKLVK